MNDSFIAFRMRNKIFTRYRQQYIPYATGVVLEIGAGTGANFSFYGDTVSHLYALEPSSGLRKQAQMQAYGKPFTVEFLEETAERISLESDSVDTVVSTWTLCSVSDPERVLAEVRRILKPGGKFIVVEHGKVQTKYVAFLQAMLTPLWKLAAGNCHLDRNFSEYLNKAGFDTSTLLVGRTRPGWYEGVLQ